MTYFRVHTKDIAYLTGQPRGIFTAIWKLVEAKTVSAEEEKEYYNKGMNILFNDYLNAIENHDKENIIYEMFLNNQSTTYLENTHQKRMVIDFIAGMTDDLFMSELSRKNCKN